MEQTLAFYINLLRGDFTQFCAQRLKELGLSQGLLYFLLYVGRHPGCSAGELASVIGADSGHTTRSVEKLVQRGMLARRVEEKNRRVVRLSLQSAAAEAIAQGRKAQKNFSRRLFAGISPQEQAEFARVLRHICKNAGLGETGAPAG